VYWIMGSLADRSLTQVWLAAPPMLAGIGLLLTVGRALDALTLGEDAARSLGIDLARTRLMVVAGTALSVGAATAVTGIIGFVGLIVPHALRPLAGHRPALLLPASFLGGAIMLLVADEPTAGLDPAHQLALFRHFTALAAAGRTVVVALHDLSLAARFCHRIVLMQAGRAVAAGAPEDVLRIEHLAAVYGIKARYVVVDGVPVVLPLDVLP